MEKNLPYPCLIKLYVDNCWGVLKYDQPRRLGLRSATAILDPGESFNEIPNSIHPRIKFTHEEEANNSLAFLNVQITRNKDQTLSTKVYQKESNTNVIISPSSCHHPSIHEASFKGEICRARRICLTESQAKKEIDLTLNVFQDNGHNRSKLEQIATGKGM